MKQHFQQFARYNRWANRRLYAVVAAVPEAQFLEDRGAFFGSLCGTLNHILVADRIWMRRIEGAGPQPPSLDAILHGDFATLRAAREAEDERIIRITDGTDEARLAGTLAYTSMMGGSFEQPFAQVLTHVFNHQTHHRGQAHALLTQIGHEGPVLDFLYFLRDADA